ncbi:MAG: hypothetical protein F6K17_37615 [Okeania sp. SIO3C4]|nr:hypothetical protein [Okeania sp. SIO3C4]
MKLGGFDIIHNRTEGEISFQGELKIMFASTLSDYCIYVKLGGFDIIHNRTEGKISLQGELKIMFASTFRRKFLPINKQLTYINSRGSVTYPVSAEAAAV